LKIKIYVWLLFFTSWLLFTAPLLANEEISIDCAKAMGAVELKYCAAQAYRLADEDLNHVWNSFSKDLPAEYKRELVEAQRAWVKFRDSNCNAETFLSRGGTGYIYYYDYCLERMTRYRTEELRNLLEEN
jgi:uncharacterized protein YecT (DUF1311 family)